MSDEAPEVATGEGWLHMPCTLDDGPAPRAAIGLIAMANDRSIEPELRAFLPKDGVALYVNRIPLAPKASVEGMLEMGRHIDKVAAGIVPDDHLNVLAFGITSGTMVIGEDAVMERLRKGRPGISYTTPITAAFEALRRLDARRIALLTPYPDTVNVEVERYIAEHGFEIVVKGSFKQSGDWEIVRISPKAIYDATLELGRADVDAVFISGTAVRTSSIQEAAEAALGKPVVGSSQAVAWHCLRLAGYSDPVEGYGRLLTI